MKTRKVVIAVLTAIVLISALFIAGCIDQIEELSAKPKTIEAQGAYTNDGDYQIPAGKGLVVIKINDSDARTILPDPDLANRKFNLLIKDSSNADIVNVSALTYSQMTTAGGTGNYKTVSMQGGTGYSFSIVAIDTSNNAVAGYDTTFSITSGSTTTISAVLKPYTAGTGKFSFNFTASTNGSSTFDILPYPGSSSIGTSFTGTITGNPTTFPLTASASGTINLNSGYYTVKITSTLAKHQTREYIHALHIYQNMESVLDSVNMGTLVQNEFDVNFNLNLLSGDSNSNATYSGATQSKKYGHYADNPCSTGNPTSTNLNTWVGWNTKIDGTGDTWNFTSSRVLADITLYGKWTLAGTPGSASIDISFPIDDQASVTGTTTIDKTALLGGTTIVLKLANNSWNAIKWSIGGNTIGAPHVTDNDNTGDTLTINNSTTFLEYFADPAGFTVNVESSTGTGAAGDPVIPYTKSVAITYTP